MSQDIEEVIARIIAADTDLNVEFNLPPNTVNHFRGRPILALDESTNNLTVPSRLLHHPLVRDRYFCTLPGALWDDVVRRVGADRFDPALVELETHLSTMCGDHSQNAGFRQGRAFVYCLRRQPITLPEEHARAAGLDRNQAQLDFVGSIGEERLAGMFKTTRAYAGWLMTNPQFLGELDELLRTWSSMIARWGFDRLGIVLPRGMFLPGDDPTADARWPAYSEAFTAFFERWRLRGMAAPYLPEPLAPQMSGHVLTSAVSPPTNSGGVFMLPDTFPIPARDELRGMLDDALHGAPPAEHLTEWMELIAADNAAKKPFAKFARLFEVQHYYRLLHHRHEAALRRKLGPVKKALADFLEVEERTIVDDLTFLNQRLGPEWIDRGRDC